MDLLKKLKRINPFSNIAYDGMLSDITETIDTGSYMFNALLSGSIFGGFPTNRIVGLAGSYSCGKSFLSLHICKSWLNLDPNNYVIYSDSENALEKKTIIELGLDSNRVLHSPVKSIEDYRNQTMQMLEIIKADREANKAPNNPNPRFLFVLDSLGMMVSEKEIKDSLDDKNKMDMGLRAKLVKGIFRLLTIELGFLKFPMIVTSHTYDNPANPFSTKSNISGGTGLTYASSFIVCLFPKVEKTATNTISGLILTAKAEKTRSSAKQYSTIQMRLSFSRGLDRFYGLTDLGLESGILKKEGRKIIFPNGERYFPNEIDENPQVCFTKEILDLLDKEAQIVFSYGKEQVDEALEKSMAEDELKNIQDMIDEEKLNEIGGKDVAEEVLNSDEAQINNETVIDAESNNEDE